MRHPPPRLHRLLTHRRVSPVMRLKDNWRGQWRNISPFRRGGAGNTDAFLFCFLFGFGNHMAAAGEERRVYTLVFTCIFPGRGSEVAHVREAERWSDGKPEDAQPAVGNQANSGVVL